MNLVRLIFFYFILFLGIFAGKLYGQGNIIPPSPESFALVRSIQHPVDHYTGVANIQVPLFTLGNGNIEVPVGISYQASGIKVQDMATCVGLGWRLAAGGKITRIVRKTPDEQGYCKSSDFAQTDGYQAMNIQSWVGCEDYRDTSNFDTEPDLFYFEIPGRSGMFVVNFDRSIHTIPYQAISIEWVNQDYFKITDEGGTMYLFGSNYKETTVSVRQSWHIPDYSSKHYSSTTTLKKERAQSVIKTHRFTSTWHLEEIRPVNAPPVRFHYQTGNELNYRNYDEQTRIILSVKDNRYTSMSPFCEVNVLPCHTDIKVISPRYISKISCGDESIAFEYSNRSDLANGFRLHKVKYLAPDSEKTREFAYTYFSRGGELALKLDRIVQGQTKPTMSYCRFDYNTDRELPGRNSPDFDHWGYYNGKGNTSNFVRFYFHFDFGEASRDIDTLCTQANILTHIYLPTGAYTHYEYEQHEGFQKVGGVRIRSITQYDSPSGIGLTTRYRYQEKNSQIGTGERFTDDPPEYEYEGYRNYRSNEELIYMYVRSSSLNNLFDLNGAPVCYHTVWIEHPNGIVEKCKYTSYSTPGCSDRRSWMYNLPYPSLPVRTNYSSMFTHTSQFWKRGLLKERTLYEGEDVLQHSVFEYELDPLPRGQISGFQLSIKRRVETENNKTVIHADLSEYLWKSQPLFLRSVITTGRDVIHTQENYEYDETYLLPTYIQHEDLSTNTVYSKRLKYPFHYTLPGATRQESKAIEAMKRRHVLNWPIEVLEYKNHRTVLGTINEYRLVPTTYNAQAILLSKTHQMNPAAPVSNYVNYAPGVSGAHIYDPRYKFYKHFTHFDPNGRVTSVTDNFGNRESVVYSRDGLYPIAQVTNAVHSCNTVRDNEVFYTSFEDPGESSSYPSTIMKSGRHMKLTTDPYHIPLHNFVPGDYILTYWRRDPQKSLSWEKVQKNISVDVSTVSYPIFNEGYIDEVRVLPKRAEIKTSTYQRGTGVSSETDHNGLSVYYIYDQFGRLKSIYDNDRLKMREYEYFLKNQ